MIIEIWHGNVLEIRFGFEPGDSLDLEHLCELDRILSKAEKRPTLEGMILRGPAPGGFGSGFAKTEFLCAARTRIRSLVGMLGETVQHILRFPAPTVACIEGPCLGAGAMLALACESRVMLKNAGCIGFPEVRQGLIVPAVPTLLLSQCVGEEKAREMLIKGRLLSAERAHQIGLVGRLVHGATTLPRGLSYIEDCHAKGPASSAQRQVFKGLMLRQIDWDLKHRDTDRMTDYICSPPVQALLKRTAGCTA